jgi:hypothetical protein
MKKNLLLLILGLIISLACANPMYKASTPTPTVEPIIFDSTLPSMDDIVVYDPTSGLVTITMTEQQMNQWLAVEVNNDPSFPASGLSVALRNGQIEITGKFQQDSISADFTAVCRIVFDSSGAFGVEIAEAKLGPIPAPDIIKTNMSSYINTAINQAIQSQAPGFKVTGVQIADGVMIITGTMSQQ